jgi:hypothetical protein
LTATSRPRHFEVDDQRGAIAAMDAVDAALRKL